MAAPPAAISHAAAFGNLALTCIAMLVGAYGCGMIPSLVAISEARLGLVNAVGAGLLLGSALCIILPEGFEAVAEAAEEHGLAHGVPGLVLLLGFWVMMALDAASHRLGHGDGGAHHAHGNGGQHHPHGNGGQHHAHGNGGGSGGERQGGYAQGGAVGGARSGLSGGGGGAHSDLELGEGDGDELQPLARSGGVGGGSGLLLGAPDGRQAAAAAGLRRDPARQVLLGLLVHAAADGVAVGAASLSSSSAVSISVALAMVVHKGPVAVGLTTYLQGARWAPAKVAQGLLLFAAASPAVALLSFMLLAHIPALASEAGIALVVLFSGGTVLYAACVHILPGVLGGGGGMPRQQLAAVTAGMLTPLLLAMVIHHDHHHH